MRKRAICRLSYFLNYPLPIVLYPKYYIKIGMNNWCGKVPQIENLKGYCLILANYNTVN